MRAGYRPPMHKLIPLVLVVGLLAACSPAEEADPTTTSEAAVETTTSEPAPTTTTTEAPEETTTTETPEAAGGPDCLVGSWVLDTESMLASLEDVFAQAGMGEGSVTAADGTYTVEMAADGTYNGERDGWGFSVSTPEGDVNMRMTGQESGTWSADDSTITVTVDTSDVTMEATVEAGGQVVQMPSAPVNVPDPIPTASAYTCEGDVLTVTSEDTTAILNRS